MKLATIKFVEPILVPKIKAQQSWRAGQPVPNLTIDLSAQSRVVYIKATPRGGHQIVVGVPLERVLSFEPAPEELGKETSAARA